MRLAVFLFALPLVAVPPESAPAGRLLLSDDFPGNALAGGWKSPKGTWTVADGALRGVELASDHHAAVVRRAVAYRDAVIEVDFRFDGGKQFALSLNRTGGHACRAILRPGEAILQRDKLNKKSELGARVLGRAKTNLAAGQWHRLRLTVQGRSMNLSIDGEPVVSGEDEHVDVDKVDVGLPVSGDSVSFRRLRVWGATR